MGWIGVNDFASPTLTPEGGRPTALSRARTSPDALIPTGSFVVETPFVSDPEGVVLLSHSVGGDWGFAIDLSLLPGGRQACLSLQQRHSKCVTRLDLPALDARARLRFTVTWEAPRRTGMLTLEDLDTGTLRQAAISAPPPLQAAVLGELAQDRAHECFDPAVTLFAVSDRIEPVGLMPGFAAGTRIETEHGPRLIETLRRGDMVLTGTGELRPIRWLTTREVPRKGGFAPVRLRAPFFGLEHDLRLAQDHRIAVSGTEAEYLIGEDQVMVEARHLLASRSAVLEAAPGLMRYYQILLDTHETLHANGGWSESQFVPRDGLTAELLAATPLADLTMAALPRHSRITSPTLREFETVALVASMIA